MKAMEDFQSSLLVMSTLLTTVTFTAAFTMPGGLKSEGIDQGMATLLPRAGFKVFMISDTVSMCSSLVATGALIIFSAAFNSPYRFDVLKVAMGALVISVAFMLVAFVAGVWLVIGTECIWLAILIALVTSSTPLLLTRVVARSNMSNYVHNEDKYFVVDDMV